MICDKARYGKVGTYVMGFNGNKCKFYSNADDARNELIDFNKNKTKISPDRAMSNVRADF